MAERRMLAKTIIDSDVFLDMPLSTQALYMHLSMQADDDGFLNNPKKIMRYIGAAQSELEMLILRKFLLVFQSGVVVIKHWLIHNYIQKDRYKKTIYQDEFKKLKINTNKSYKMINSVPVYTPCIQDVSSLDSQVRLELGKDRLGEVRVEEVSIAEEEPAKPKKGKALFLSLLPETFKNSTDFIEAVDAFMEVRKRKKAANTERAFKTLTNFLTKEAGNDIEKAIAIIDKSVVGGYPGLYPVNGYVVTHQQSEIQYDHKNVDLIQECKPETEEERQEEKRKTEESKKAAMAKLKELQDAKY